MEEIRVQQQQMQMTESSLPCMTYVARVQVAMADLTYFIIIIKMKSTSLEVDDLQEVTQTMITDCCTYCMSNNDVRALYSDSLQAFCDRKLLHLSKNVLFELSTNQRIIRKNKL